MEIQGRTVMILGGSGLVGLAVARRLLTFRPRAVIISALRREEAESAVAELRGAREYDEGTDLIAEWGDMFMPDALKNRGRGDVLADPDDRGAVLDDLFGELTPEVVDRSMLGALVLRHRPELIVDCVNTATAFAYQNVFESAMELRDRARRGDVDAEAVERHLSTLYLPQLIRHAQIALEAMKRAETEIYLKVGTAGTGGMGLNVPFTHSEERPSRMLLSKAGLAGAQTLLLFLMARTPDAPAVKEIKPTAAISWKRIGYGEITRHGKPIPRWDATEPVPLDGALADGHEDTYTRLDDAITGVYIDSGENGFFSLPEFEALTDLGLMEFITPEEIAENAVREIRGHPTGRDVIGALDGATSGPTFRAGYLRQSAVQAMEELEREHDVQGVAYEMLGPPRLTKLLFEAALLSRLYDDLAALASLDPDETSRRAWRLIQDDRDLRTRIISIGLPILLPDGEQVLRGPEIKVRPSAGQRPDDPRVVDNGWIDLRPANWRKWRDRAAAIGDDLRRLPGPAEGSQTNALRSDGDGPLRPSRLVAWVLRREDEGERIKR